ncbi:hypothetical protein DR64_924 [Paraburkholderia xenovorans LB400]|nr:hypothetical protein DR64_924 [Paraburkholderia xenovorans LB400]
MPEAAVGVGEGRVVGGIVEKQFAVARFAAVLLVDRADQRGGDRRTVALHDVADMAVGGRTQLRERLFGAALAVQHDQFERMRTVGKLDAAMRVHLLDAEAQIALHRRARVGERAGHAFDQRQLDGRAGGFARGLRCGVSWWYCSSVSRQLRCRTNCGASCGAGHGLGRRLARRVRCRRHQKRCQRRRRPLPLRHRHRPA